MATLETQLLDATIASTRRRMLTLGGAALAGLAFTSVAAQAQTLTDADYLNFALNLEYLEANFYTLAATGMTIDQSPYSIGLNGVGTQGTVTTKAGGPASCKVNFQNTLVANYATEIAMEERNHVSLLRSALGSTAAVAQPAIDLFNSFNGLAGLLGVAGLTAFDPFADDASFLLGSYIFEDVGVTAYTGAAPALTDKSAGGTLDTAAGIQGVEAYHAGLIRTTIYGLDQTPNTVNGQMAPAGTLRALATAISKLRATVDGSNTISANNTQGDDIGLGTQMVALNGTTANITASTIVDATTTGSINIPTSGNTAGSLVFARSAAEVLAIVYAGGSGKGGFFPAGLNGTVK